jgi:hypothetical protein
VRLFPVHSGRNFQTRPFRCAYPLSAFFRCGLHPFQGTACRKTCAAAPAPRRDVFLPGLQYARVREYI